MPYGRKSNQIRSLLNFGRIIGSAPPDLVQCLKTMKIVRNMKLNGRNTGCFLLIAQPITLLLCLFFISLNHASAQLTWCDLSFNYTEDSQFGNNLNTVLNNLVEHTFETGFNTSMDGQSPDTAYGLLQCFRDATTDQCHYCSQRASTSILQNQSCGNAVGGRIWMDVCFLRYENYNFIGQLDTNGTWLHNANSVSNPDDFDAHLKNLFTNLSAEAANVGARKGYASGTTEDSFSPKIYALVMCTRDISTKDCTDCLLQASGSISWKPRGSGNVRKLHSYLRSV